MSRKKSKTLRSNKRATQQQKAEEKFEWFEKWAGPGLIVIVFSLMAFWSWRKWPDLLVDFGQQLYIPWQLASGKLLYKDIVILHGPLSQYFNAFWFKLFGPSLTVLIFVNLAILAGITVVLYKTDPPVRRFLNCDYRLSCFADFVRLFAVRPESATTTTSPLIPTSPLMGLL